MMLPVICALTTATLPPSSTKMAMISSARLPKVTLSSPPMVCPARAATCSVALRSQSASGMMATVEAANTHSGGA